MAEKIEIASCIQSILGSGVVQFPKTAVQSWGGPEWDSTFLAEIGRKFFVDSTT